MTQPTWHIHIQGIVQGVGFRPFVYQLAQQHQLTGWVYNGNDGVHIEIQASRPALTLFVDKLLAQAPERAHIMAHSVTELSAPSVNTDFRIVESREQAAPQLLITPDFAMCPTCRQEINEPDDRRFHYPFTTCTQCGPRYSIINRLPYDRERTTMAPFAMCPTCQTEYEEVTDRRYFSQTNSCPDCAIQLSFWDVASMQWHAAEHDSEALLAHTVAAWRAGQLIAIKGIGGYLLTCDATNADAVRLLRKRKNRPTKPLALMYHDLLILAEDLEVGAGDMVQLESTEAPIVLLPRKADPLTPVAFDEVAPNMHRVGVMLPYTPLYALLLEAFGGPIVATSANVSGTPIVFEDDRAIECLSPLADGILTNNRAIVVPQDDSVRVHTPLRKRPVMMRRSRGIAPNLLEMPSLLTQKNVLATGALLKSTFCFTAQGNAYLSQYLGNTTDYDTQQNYQRTLEHLLSVFGVQPDIILSDRHPRYFSTELAGQLAAQWSVPHIQVPHHRAHFWAALAEHQLVASAKTVIGVIWDGTGLGEDDQVWGGEFFRYARGQVDHVDQLPPYPAVLGDKMPREPRISAWAIGRGIPEVEALIQPLFSEEEWRIYQQLGPARLQTSSMGRLFDAAAAVLLDIDRQSFEGEAAMHLEAQAHRYFRQALPRRELSYLFGEALPDHLPRFLLTRLTADRQQGVDTTVAAARFHCTLADYAGRIVRRHGGEVMVCSGGVFQNSWLVDLVDFFWGKEFALYFHKSLAPNDENIAYGQLIYYQHEIERA